MKVTVNSDDYYAMTENYEMTKEDVVLLAKNSFDIAWLSADEKTAYFKEISDYVAQAE